MVSIKYWNRKKMSARKKRPVTYHLYKERFVAEGWRYPLAREIKMSWTWNTQYYCSHCGEIWASEVVQFGHKYIINNRSCTGCRPDESYSGSILIGFAGIDRDRWEGAPHDLLIYEFLNLMKKRGM